MKKYYLIISLLTLLGCKPNTKKPVAHTYPIERIDTTFAIIGDYGDPSPKYGERSVADLVIGWKPAFIVTVGDNSYGDDDDGRLQTNVGDVYGRYISDSTFFPCVGNHDHANRADDTLKSYKAFFKRPANYHVRMDKINCYLYFLDSGWDGSENAGHFEQYTKDSLLTWLKQDTLNYFKIVFFHHPPYSDAWHGSNAGTQLGFDTLGVDAVICGHDHLYERIVAKKGSPPLKTLYLVDGSGGARLYTEHSNRIPPNLEVVGRVDSTWGAVKAVCSRNKVGFYFVNTHGVTLDSSFVEHR
jgi:tartrate-resistant acid phosphatase type 5